MGPLRIGVLGCADIARRRMLPAMAASADMEIACLASRDPRRARDIARPYGCRAYGDYQQALDDPDVDVVYVPLPASLHARWTEAALTAGKHVLAEKPLTTDRAETAALLDAAQARGLVLRENVMFVHHSQHRTVRDLLTKGVIGELRSMRAEFTIPLRPDGDIRHCRELGGGALWDTGVYPVRAALHFLGPRLSVLGAASANGAGKDVDTAGAALLHTPDGVTAHLSFGLDHGYRSLYELTGSQGRITLDRAFTPSANHAPAVRVERPEGTEELFLPPDDQVARALDAFVAAVRAGAGSDSGSAASTCLRQAELLDEIAVAST
ncbi:Gfo/Idh/MocA family oxidoreductase [Streptomyces sp. NPDC047097]|uniref:Gfo/Idh/MocA family protein n=1 Tax=Streptomyces sp. NPDC047097 TaxID=3155260 RepID=UPI0033CAB263